MWEPGCELRADGRRIALGQDSRGQNYRTWTSEKSGLQGRNIPAAAPVHWDAVQKAVDGGAFPCGKGHRKAWGCIHQVREAGGRQFQPMTEQSKARGDRAQNAANSISSKNLEPSTGYAADSSFAATSNFTRSTF